MSYIYDISRLRVKLQCSSNINYTISDVALKIKYKNIIKVHKQKMCILKIKTQKIKSKKKKNQNILHILYILF